MYIEYVYFNNRGNRPKKKYIRKTDKAERRSLDMYMWKLWGSIDNNGEVRKVFWIGFVKSIG